MISLYLHIPWCVRKCPYCDFNSHAGQPQEQAYIAALRRDLGFELQQRAGWPRLCSIFIGGGTPSLLSGPAINEILQLVDDKLPISANTEITLEANPGTADAANFKAYRQAGVNRLSIGAQSFDSNKLQSLGRIHGGNDIYAAYDMARAAGFNNINLDLMHSLPHQTQTQALADLASAIELQPEHLSWYELTIEANTAFAQQPPELPDIDAQADIEVAGLAMLKQAGYRRYEVSAFSKPGYRCAHNMNYWRFGDYLGIGAGAHGKLTQGGQTLRRGRLRSPARYMDKAGTADVLAQTHRPSPQELISEFALNCFRIEGAFSKKRFEQTTGLSWQALDASIAEASALGLVKLRKDRVSKTALGQQHLNRLLECFAQ